MFKPHLEMRGYRPTPEERALFQALQQEDRKTLAALTQVRDAVGLSLREAAVARSAVSGYSKGRGRGLLVKEAL